MTIISTLITKSYTVHSSDSLITQINKAGKREGTEWEQTKIVKVPAFRGAMSYWGLAKYDYQNEKFNTYDFLQQQANQAQQSGSPEKFAIRLANELNSKLSDVRFASEVEKGIGIHFTAYEYIHHYWIPELFLISNWGNTEYKTLRSAGVGVTRESYRPIDQVIASQEDTSKEEYRLKVHSYLIEGYFLMYNNGDPVMFNIIANAVGQSLNQLVQRGMLKPIVEVDSHIALIQRPIEIVSKIQTDFCRDGTRVVGGKPHNLAINSITGEYHSSTGDN